MDRVLLYLKACEAPALTSLNLCAGVLRHVENQLGSGEEKSSVPLCMEKLWEYMPTEIQIKSDALNPLPIRPALNRGHMVPENRRAFRVRRGRSFRTIAVTFIILLAFGLFAWYLFL